MKKAKQLIQDEDFVNVVDCCFCYCTACYLLMYSIFYIFENTFGILLYKKYRSVTNVVFAPCIIISAITYEVNKYR
jgi:hypothetical protein